MFLGYYYHLILEGHQEKFTFTLCSLCEDPKSERNQNRSEDLILNKNHRAHRGRWLAFDPAT